MDVNKDIWIKQGSKESISDIKKSCSGAQNSLYSRVNITIMNITIMNKYAFQPFVLDSINIKYNFKLHESKS